MDTTTTLIAFNSFMNLVIIYFLLPLWKIKGQMEGIYVILESHENRLHSIEHSSRR